MQCGISTSCFYPQETAEALSALRGAGVETVEIFLNTFSELELSYTERLRSVLQDAGIRRRPEIRVSTVMFTKFL